MYNEELMYEDTRGDFVEKEMKRTEGSMPYVLLFLALAVDIIILGKTEFLVVAIFIIGVLLGGIAGYKFAFDRIRRK